MSIMCYSKQACLKYILDHSIIQSIIDVVYKYCKIKKKFEWRYFQYLMLSRGKAKTPKIKYI